MFNLLVYEFKSRLVPTLLWGITLALFGSTYITIYPQVEEQIKALADWSIYQAIGFDMGTFEGFLGSTVVLTIPLILGIYVITSSTQTLAGEEEEGTLELLLSMPLHRWQIVCAKAVPIAVSTLVVLVIVGIGDGLVLERLKNVVAVDITFRQFIIAVINGWPLTLVVAMMGLFLGAYLPTQRSAAMTLTVFFITSYFADNFASHVESLSTLAPFSIFTYHDTSADVFRHGVRATDFLVLLGLAAFFFLLALLSFQRRNVTVGTWPWQRTKIGQE